MEVMELENIFRSMKKHKAKIFCLQGTHTMTILLTNWCVTRYLHHTRLDICFVLIEIFAWTTKTINDKKSNNRYILFFFPKKYSSKNLWVHKYPCQLSLSSLVLSSHICLNIHCTYTNFWKTCLHFISLTFCGVAICHYYQRIVKINCHHYRFIFINNLRFDKIHGLFTCTEWWLCLRVFYLISVNEWSFDK